MQFAPSIKPILIALFIAALSACGGGGGGGGRNNPPPTAPAVSQTIVFSSAGPMSLSVGDSVANAASGPGSGALSYSSSNTAVATVDAAGTVIIVGIGSAVITANKAADAQYLAASASYTINSVVTFSAWIGDTDTLVNFPAAADGLVFYRSSAANCNLNLYLTCTNGQRDTLSGAPATDSAVSLSQIGY
jgi:hypothetical protein